jgi:hypothetical protein
MLVNTGRFSGLVASLAAAAARIVRRVRIAAPPNTWDPYCAFWVPCPPWRTTQITSETRWGGTHRGEARTETSRQR